jgi:hypothetical protein
VAAIQALSVGFFTLNKTSLNGLITSFLLAAWVGAVDLSKVPQIHETPEQRDARMQWFRDAKFGMFIHWGPCSVGSKEIGWDSQANRPWDINGIQTPRTIDPVYDNDYKQFNPTKYNAEEWESCIHVGRGWSYHGEDGFKGPEDCIKMLVSCTTGGGNLLLNFGPRPDGTFAEGEAKVARAMGGHASPGPLAAAIKGQPQQRHFADFHIAAGGLDGLGFKG